MREEEALEILKNSHWCGTLGIEEITGGINLILQEAGAFVDVYRNSEDGHQRKKVRNGMTWSSSI